MNRGSVELSVRYDGQSQSESEHASLIDQPQVAQALGTVNMTLRYSVII